jgi:histidine phosphotransfer protein HptB
MRVQSAGKVCILDVDGSLARFGGDKQLFTEMTAMLVEDAPPLFAQLKAALARSDAPQVESRAHALKGLLVNCGGARAAQTAQQLEDAGRAKNIQQSGALIEELNAELDALVAAINEYRLQSSE